MKKPVSLLFLMVMVVFVLFSFPVKPAFAAGGSTVAASLSDIKGDVFVKRGGGLREFPAYSGMPLNQGDWVRTSDDSSVKITYQSGSETVLGSNTELSIDKLASGDMQSQGYLKRIFSRDQQISIKLWAGSIWNNVKTLLNINDQYEVQTPTAIMGVHGTLYQVSVDQTNGATNTNVLDGIVAVTQNTDPTQSGDERFVSAGKTLDVVTDTEHLPEQQDLNLESLVSRTEPQMLVQMLADVTARIGELTDQAKQAQDSYQQTKDINQIKDAVILAQKSIALAGLAQNLVGTVQNSAKANQVQDVLKENNQTLEQVQTNINQVQEATQQTQTQVNDTAKNAGLSPDEITDIVQDAPLTPPPAPVEPPAPAPSPTPAPPSPPPDNSGSSDNSDNSAPTDSGPQLAGEPQIVNQTSTTVNFAVQFNKDASVYYEVVPSGTPAPSGDQVLAGQAAAGYPVFYAADTSVIAAGTDATLHAANLQGNTGYDLYIMARDTSSIPMASPAKLSFTTSVPPSIVAGYPKVTNIAATSFDLTFKFNSATTGTTAYFVVLPAGTPAPDSLQVIAEQDGAGHRAKPVTGSNGVIPAGSESVTSYLTYLPSDQQYDIYVTAKDTLGNYMQAPVRTSVYLSTALPPSPAVTVTGSTVNVQGQANATLTLYNSAGTSTNTVTADSNGVAGFTNVPSGYYQVSQIASGVESSRVSFSVYPQFTAAGTDRLAGMPQYITLTFADNISAAILNTTTANGVSVPQITFADGSTYWIGIWDSLNNWSLSLEGVNRISPNTIAIAVDGAGADKLYWAYLCQGTPTSDNNAVYNQEVSGINFIFDTTYLDTSATDQVAGTQFNLNVYRAAQPDGTPLDGSYLVHVRSNTNGLIYGSLPVSFSDDGDASIPVTLSRTGAQTLTVSIDGASIDGDPVGVSINLNVTPGPAGWAQTYAGSAGLDIRKTPDLGYAVAGEALQGDNGYDGYLMKTDGNGNLIWSKYFGGTGDDYFNSLDITSDQGYILDGSSNTTTGSAIYLVKTDFNGNLQWEQTFGTTNNNAGYSVKQTPDGGYIIAGVQGADSTGFGGSFYLLKTDASGNKLWEKTYGEGCARSVQLTSDGGYIITGWTIGADNTTDVYLVKTDADGNMVWAKTFGNGNTDYGLSGQPTTDGGYIVVGYTYLPGATTDDVYLIKTDNSGNAQWEKTYGGMGMDEGYAVQQTTDEGYIITGSTDSFGSGSQDAYLIKTDSYGTEQWEKTFGGTGGDSGKAVQQTQTGNGGYIIAGSANDGNNIYLIKTDPDGNVPSQSGATADTTIASTGTPADFWVTCGSTGLTGASNSIVSNNVAIDANMTVGTFLSHLVKQNTGQQWIVTAAADAPVDAAHFGSATVKADADILAQGDICTVLSSDGTTIRSYAITVKPV